MPSKSPIVPLSSADRTGTGSGASVDLVQCTTADLVVTVTAIDDGATLDVWIETSDDGATWAPLGEHVLPITQLGLTAQVFPGANRYIRARWSLTGPGTPHATFSVRGSAVLVYATPANLGEMGIPDDRIDDLSDVEKDRWLRLATDEASGGVQERYGMPLLEWGDDLRNVVCSIAAWMILTKVVGVNPDENNPDSAIKGNSDAAYKKVASVARGDSNFVGIVDSTPDVENDGGAFIYSDAPRGWTR